jgi:uncharacterized membrane protein YbhN (UPF0104 family)
MQEAQTWDLRSMVTFPIAFLGLFLLLSAFPAVKILRRTGHNPLWCVLAIFPVLNLAAFWFFAFKSWPTDKKPPVP